MIVDVPNLCVERIRLNVQNLDARLALNARVANLVRVPPAPTCTSARWTSPSTACARRRCCWWTWTTWSTWWTARSPSSTTTRRSSRNSPARCNSTLGTVGGVANQALRPGGVADQAVGTVGQTLNNVTAPGGVLSQTVNTLGQTVQRTVDATGNIVEQHAEHRRRGGEHAHRRAAAGACRCCAKPPTPPGRRCGSVRDQSGAVIEYVLGEGGRVVSSRVTTPAPRQAPR